MAVCTTTFKVIILLRIIIFEIIKTIPEEELIETDVSNRGGFDFQVDQNVTLNRGN